MQSITVILVIAVVVLLAIQLFPRQKPALWLRFSINNQTFKGVIKMIQLRDGQQQPFKAEFVDREGQPTTVQAGSVQISSSDPEVAEIIRSETDETAFTIKALKPGSCQVNVSADAIEGEGVRNVEDFVAVEVRAGEAVGVNIAATGDPEDYPVIE